MANKIGEVLEIKLEDSYIKIPIGPMIMVETCDIDKLAEYIHIPSMVEGATVKDTTLQRILYSGLPNQCWKCCQFGYFAQTCTMTSMNNKIEFVAPAHSLFLKQGVGGEERQVHKKVPNAQKGGYRMAPPNTPIWPNGRMEA
jgi:hypothetical protein